MTGRSAIPAVVLKTIPRFVPINRLAAAARGYRTQGIDHQRVDCSATGAGAGGNSGAAAAGADEGNVDDSG
jgi:hypothetical protein